MTNFVENNDLFERLKDKQDKIANYIEKKDVTPILKARKNASLDDFVSMVAKIVSKALAKENAEFIPDEGAVLSDPQKKVEHPYILYSVVSRVPKLELKPRQMENIIENIGDTKNRRFGRNWNMRQTCIIQFDVLASDYETANKVMSTFEEMMFSYSGYFKANGISELLFKKYFTDKNLDKYRQWLSVRSIQYEIEIEKLITVFDTTIEDIEV